MKRTNSKRNKKRRVPVKLLTLFIGAVALGTAKFVGKDIYQFVKTELIEKVVEVYELYEVNSTLLSHFHYKELSIDEISWFGITTPNSKEAFFVTSLSLAPKSEWLSESEPVYLRNLDVFKRIDGRFENILHIGKSWSSYYVYSVYYDGKPYLLVQEDLNGSGNYGSFSMYKYIETVGLKKVFQTREYFGAGAIVEGNSIRILGDTQEYLLVYQMGQFHLKRTERRSIANAYPSAHRLKLSYSNELITVTFDGKPVEFVLAGKDQFVAKNTIALFVGDVLEVDKNASGPQQLRVMDEDDSSFEYYSGNHSMRVAKKQGNATLRVSHNYEKWYEIKFQISE